MRGAGALALLLVGAVACDDPRAARPDVLLVTVDTLRRDHVSAYGLPFGGTRAIDRLADSGVLFERHYTVVGLTEPSHVTLFTGLYPRQHGVRRNGVTLPPDLPLLAELLSDAGYRTGAAIGAGVLGSRFGLDRGFERFDETFNVPGGGEDNPNHFERVAEDVVDAALEYLAATSDAGEPVFLWVHVFDPHLPHVRPVAERPEAAALTDGGAVFAEPSFLHDAEHIEGLRRDYVAEVRYADSQIGRLLEAWDGRTRERDDVVVLTADHGEALGEHAYVGHSLYLYEEQLAVPLVLRAAGRIAPGRRVPSITSVIDVGATILDLARVPQPRRFGGTSLLALVDRDAADPARVAFAERPPLAGATKRRRTGKERDIEHWDPQNQQGLLLREFFGQPGGAELSMVALITSSAKYIWSEDVPDELFDLARDARERTNLADGAGRHPLLDRIDGWRATTPTLYTAPKGEDAVETEEMLDALGY